MARHKIDLPEAEAFENELVLKVSFKPEKVWEMDTAVNHIRYPGDTYYNPDVHTRIGAIIDDRATWALAETDPVLKKIWQSITNADKVKPKLPKPPVSGTVVKPDYYDITHTPSLSTASLTISEINSSEIDDRHALHAKMVELFKQTHPALYAAILDRAASALWPIEKTAEA